MDKKKSKSVSIDDQEERRVLELQDAFRPAFRSFSSVMNLAVSYLHTQVFRRGGRLEDILRMSRVEAGALPKLGPQRADTLSSNARPVRKSAGRGVRNG